MDDLMYKPDQSQSLYKEINLKPLQKLYKSPFEIFQNYNDIYFNENLWQFEEEKRKKKIIYTGHLLVLSSVSRPSTKPKDQFITFLKPESWLDLGKGSFLYQIAFWGVNEHPIILMSTFLSLADQSSGLLGYPNPTSTLKFQICLCWL